MKSLNKVVFRCKNFACKYNRKNLYLEDLKEITRIEIPIYSSYFLNNRRLDHNSLILKITGDYSWKCPSCNNRNVSFESYRLWKLLNAKEQNIYRELVKECSKQEPISRKQRIDSYLQANDVFINTLKSQPIRYRIVVAQTFDYQKEKGAVTNS